MAATEEGPLSEPAQIQDWIAQRDTNLIRWFAEGMRDEDVLVLATENGYDLSPEGVREKRIELRQKVVALQAKEGQKLIESLPLAHPAARVGALSRLYERVEGSLDWCVQNEKHGYVAKLVDTGGRLVANIREEMVTLQEDEQESIRPFSMEDFSPAKRKKLIEAGRQFQEVLHSPDPDANVIDGEFEVLPNDS